MFANLNLETPININHDHDDGSGDDGSGSMNMSHTMKMYFHTDIGMDYVFFEQWLPSNAGETVGACIFLCVLAICYEALKSLRDYLLKRSREVVTANNVSNGISVMTEKTSGSDHKVGIVRRMMSYPHFIQTLLHVIQFFVSYLLMLAFMTYNAYFCIAVLVGAGIGYFLFGWNKASAVDPTECCH